MENVPVNQISLKNQEYFKVWDITKFIMSIVVVSIHTNALYSLGNILNRIICQGLSRIAVPLFFMVSAYFLYYKKGNSFISVKNFILRILKLYIFYFILFFPYIFYIRIWKYKSNGWGYALWNFISGLLFSSSFPGSWYLNAMIIASLFCLLVNKGKTARIFVVILSVSGYIFSCITSNYQALLGSGGGGRLYMKFT